MSSAELKTRSEISGIQLRGGMPIYDQIQDMLKEGHVFLRKPQKESVSMRNCTKIVFITDRSGSMSSVKDAMEEIMNGYIKNQQAQPGECVFSLYQFDDQYDAVFENVPIKSVGHIAINPRGGTALLDAIGRTIDRVGSELSTMNECDRPDKILIVIVTDGQENASREYVGAPGTPKASRINDMVSHQRTKYQWQFVFLGADQDAIGTAAGMGIDPNLSVNFTNTSAGYKGAGAKLSKMSSGYRNAVTISAGARAMTAESLKNDQTVTDADTKEWDDMQAQANEDAKKARTTPVV